MNKSARKAVNLSVLQRHDAYISDIIDSSSYVVVYKFDEASQAWTKKGVEGTMFVFKRSTAPSYGFFIMNRLGLDNLMADLTADMALQLTSDYIIYRDEKDIHGIWIYEPADRDRIGEKLMDCCKRAKEESPVAAAQSPPTPRQSAVEQRRTEHSPATTATEPAPADSLSRMLNEAMSRARVSEVSGVPSAPQDKSQSQPSRNTDPAHAEEIPRKDHSMASSTEQSGVNGEANNSSSKGEIPSFLLAIISKEKEKEQSPDPQQASPLLKQQTPRSLDSKQSMLLNSLTGSGSSVNGDRRGSSTQHGPPLSAELLPASVMPSGLYSSSNNSRSNGGGANGGGPAMQQQQGHRSSPSFAIANATLLNRPNGMAAHGSPLQPPAFAYSPGMMPSPLAMPPIPMMHPPPPSMNGGPHHPPPPPMPFQHHMAMASRGLPMGMPPQPPMPEASFPADAMHAAMGAVGFMQQQQRGFVSRGAEVMPKTEFSQQFLGLVQNDPQFMDVLYSNYTAVVARRV
ncbi:hypothetical protein BGZ70_010207 [Mortierella alpina]|uniref:Uncharacterized protein n=1 Tax=Mortierella alpina TaxID=64518 RepID=A0A9P6JF40_MORAP|nr:hypothetical protein BGZ70_010207 [Mortierella alpina]